jgi:hypothetical protein
LKHNAERKGVCRDYAHLAITCCRCLNIPARYSTGYLTDIGLPPPYPPNDFAAWIEVYLGGRWHTFDPRNNAPQIGRILIAKGRDAADVPLTHTFGPGTLSGFRVWADEVRRMILCLPGNFFLMHASAVPLLDVALCGWSAPPHSTSSSPGDAHTPAGATMTVDESKALKKGTRVYWRGDTADSGIITETSWDAVTIAWDNGQVANLHHGDMREIQQTPTKPYTA